MVEHFKATRDLVGWHGERVVIGGVAPVADWPDEYVAHLVAEGTLRIEDEGASQTTSGNAATTGSPNVATPDAPATDVVDVAGTATRPPHGHGQAST